MDFPERRGHPSHFHRPNQTAEVVAVRLNNLDPVVREQPPEMAEPLVLLAIGDQMADASATFLIASKSSNITGSSKYAYLFCSSNRPTRMAPSTS